MRQGEGSSKGTMSLQGTVGRFEGPREEGGIS